MGLGCIYDPLLDKKNLGPTCSVTEGSPGPPKLPHRGLSHHLAVVTLL